MFKITWSLNLHSKEDVCIIFPSLNSSVLTLSVAARLACIYTKRSSVNQTLKRQFYLCQPLKSSYIEYVSCQLTLSKLAPRLILWGSTAPVPFHTCILAVDWTFWIIKCCLPASPALWSWRRAHVFCTPSSDRCCCNLQQKKTRQPQSAKTFPGSMIFKKSISIKPHGSDALHSESERRITQSASCNALGGDTWQGVDQSTGTNAHDSGHCAERASHSSAV